VDFTGTLVDGTVSSQPLGNYQPGCFGSPGRFEASIGQATGATDAAWIGVGNYASVESSIYGISETLTVGAVPDTGVTAVPEIDPSGLAIALSLVMGSVAMLEQRRRRRAASAAVAVTAWPRTTHRQKLLLVGWDSADWKIIHPLLDAGELPAGAG